VLRQRGVLLDVLRHFAVVHCVQLNPNSLPDSLHFTLRNPVPKQSKARVELSQTQSQTLSKACWHPPWRSGRLVSTPLWASTPSAALALRGGAGLLTPSSFFDPFWSPAGGYAPGTSAVSRRRLNAPGEAGMGAEGQMVPGGEQGDRRTREPHTVVSVLEPPTLH
jgi:hypothetical protein